MFSKKEIRKMKIVFVLILVSQLGYGQDVIDVSFDKSVMLVFGDSNDPSHNIGSLNCGSPETVGAVKSNNKILLQAKEEFFNETNLIVELVNGELFAFTLKYNNSPSQVIFPIKVKSVSVPKKEVAKVTTGTAIPPQNITTSTTEQIPTTTQMIEGWAKEFSNEPDYLKRLAQVKSKAVFYVGGIWFKDDKLFFKINLYNDSPISYDIKSMNFYIKENKSNVVENVNLLFVLNGEEKQVEGNGAATYVAVFDKFTTSGKKMFYVQFWENGGERNFEIQIEPRDILNAKKGL